MVDHHSTVKDYHHNYGGPVKDEQKYFLNFSKMSFEIHDISFSPVFQSCKWLNSAVDVIIMIVLVIVVAFIIICSDHHVGEDGSCGGQQPAELSSVDGVKAAAQGNMDEPQLASH